MPPVTPAGAVIGRDGELALLAGMVKEVSLGRGGSVLVEGEPGIGKSALVRAAVAEAASDGCDVFWGPATSWDRPCRYCRSSTGSGCASLRRILGAR